MNKSVIVCVDDSQSILNLLNKQLQRKLGDTYDCEFAESAEEALEVIEEIEGEGDTVVMVISDQIMPGMCGDQLLVALHKRNPKMIKILLTGQAGLDSAINAINNADLFRYITKPWDEEDFLLTVEKGLQQYNLVDALELKVDQLQRLDKLKDEFLANTSHELLTPLNGVVGLTESLLDGTAGILPAKASEDLSLVVSSARRLATLVRQILDFSKLKHQNLTLRRRAVDMHALTQVVLTLSSPLVGSRNLRLVNEVPAEISPVHADEDRLLQIMHNLVGNAIKFTEAGTISISAQESHGYLAVSVTDTGIGIPEDKFETIFESFEQADGSISRAYGGTGLGLALTRQLIALHEGNISVRSKLGKGSTFSFTLPIAKGPAEPLRISPNDLLSLKLPSPVVHRGNESERAIAQAEAEHPGDEHEAGHGEPGIMLSTRGHRFRILVVDDEPVNRRILINHLSPLYHCAEAVDGISALSMVEEDRYDLILLDVMMPRLSGFETCKRLRKKYSVTELPVIYLSAKTQLSDVASGLQAGANDYLTKPIAKTELLYRVETHLQMLNINRNLEMIVDERTRQLATKNRQIMDSLHYAKHIQQAIFPDMNNIRDQLNAFVIFRPKEVVSGDFYWFQMVDDYSFMAVIDCTGHGVPGSIMSMIGFTQLNRIVKENGIIDPAAVLEHLDQGVKSVLRQEDGERNALDGMDLILVRIEPGAREITLAGAQRPLYVVSQDGELMEIKGDRRSVGGQPRRHQTHFANKRLSVEPGCCIYLATDGWADQPNEMGAKYGSPRLRGLLKEHAHLAVQQQELCFQQALDHFQGAAQQRDDITLLGIKF